jgi:hypothetical protein
MVYVDIVEIMVAPVAGGEAGFDAMRDLPQIHTNSPAIWPDLIPGPTLFAVLRLIVEHSF